MKKVLFSFLLISTFGIYGAPEDLDTSFSTDGYDLIDNGSDEHFHSVAVDGNDNIVAIGRSGSELFVARYDSSGTLDASFNLTGKFTVADYIDSSSVAPITGGVDSTNKVVVVGQTHNDNTKFRVVRLAADGSLDTLSFNTGGTPGYIDIEVSAGNSLVVKNTIVDSSNRIVVVGRYDNGTQDIPFIARVLADGSGLDTTFNSGGSPQGIIAESVFAGVSNNAGWTAVAIDGSSRIVVVGYAHGQTGGEDIVIARYSDTGVVESGFGNTNSIQGTGGIRIENISGDTYDDAAIALAIASGNEIVVAGHSTSGGSIDSFVAQFDATNGALDTNFNTTGINIFTVNSTRLNCNDMVIDAEGRIIIVGKVVAAQEAIVRFNSDGTFDSSFGSSGISYDFDATNTLTLNAAALQPNGKVVIVGTENNGNQLYVARMLSGYLSEVDTTFDTDGFVTNGFAASDKHPNIKAVFVASDNSMFLAEENDDNIKIHKLDADGVSVGGNFPATITGESNPTDIIEDADGNILVVGGGTGEWVYRYDANGDLDLTFNTVGYRASATDQQMGASATGKHIVQRANGSYIVAGNSGSNGKILALNADGTVDTNFATSGIYTAGNIHDIVVNNKNAIFFLAKNPTQLHVHKLKADGSGLDTNFAGDGTKNTTQSGQVRMGIDDSGNIIYAAFGVGGIDCRMFSDTGTQTKSGYIDNATHGLTNPTMKRLQILSDDKVMLAGHESGNPKYFVIRLTSSLGLNTGFGTGGIKRFSIDQWDAADGVLNDLEVSPSGAIITVGHEEDAAGDYTGFVARLTGATDVGQFPRFPGLSVTGDTNWFFGTNGELNLNGIGSVGNGNAKSMHILSDGKLLVGIQNNDGTTTDLLKLDASHAAEGTFNGGSRVQFATSADLKFLDTDAAGNILLCGGDGTSGSDAAWLHKVQSDGSAHATFVSPTDVIDKAYKVVEQSSGRLIVAGIEDGVATLIAYSPVTGDVDTSFGTNGRYTVAGISNPIVDIAVDTATDQLLIAYMDGSSDAQVKKLMPNAKAEVSGFSFGTAIGSVAASDQIKMRILNSGKIAVVTRNGASFRMSRYLATGATDVAEVTVSSSNLNQLHDVIALSDEKMIVIGEKSNDKLFVVRFDNSFALDTTFNPTDGYTTITMDTMIDFGAVDIASDGNIVVTGASA